MVSIRVGAFAVRHIGIGASLIDECAYCLMASFVETKVWNERRWNFFAGEADNSAFSVNMSR